MPLICGLLLPRRFTEAIVGRFDKIAHPDRSGWGMKHVQAAEFLAAIANSIGYTFDSMSAPMLWPTVAYRS